jgi:glutathione synthase
MKESVRRGHRVYFCTPDRLRLDEQNRLRAWCRAFKGGELTANDNPPVDLSLDKIDFCHMRKDPPVDTAYFQATLLLDRLPETVLQVNPAHLLRRHCEKLLPLHFPGLFPETLICRGVEELAAFFEQFGDIVVKPLNSCGGRSVLRVSRRDPGWSSTLAKLVAASGGFLQAQRFLPESSAGDKRVLMLGGEILGSLRRVPVIGDFRSNINAGGRFAACSLTVEDLAVCERVGKWLAEEGIHFAGVDLVGPYLLEINITSPSCLVELNELAGLPMERRILDYLIALHRGR